MSADDIAMDKLSVSEPDATQPGSTDGVKETPEQKQARKEIEKVKKAEEKAKKEAEKAARSAQRGQKAVVLTSPEEGDALAEFYGDSPLVQSQEQSGSVWTKVQDINSSLEGQSVRTASSWYLRYHNLNFVLSLPTFSISI